MSPPARIDLVPGAKYNLILVANPRINEPWDFELLASHVREIAPDIQTGVLYDQPVDWSRIPDGFDLPTLTFSPGPIGRFRPSRGVVCQGLPFRKSQEYAALERAGVPVPRWTVVTPTHTPDLSGFGPYVVMKPDGGGRGADVRIVRTGRVRWRSPRTDFTRATAGERCDWIVQEFVYTGAHPVSYRVATLFGEPIWSLKVEADRTRRPLLQRHGFGQDGQAGISIVASGKGSVFSPAEDLEMFALARRAHRALPVVPLIGVDILRDCETGRLFVIELNAVGFTWHLTSPIGRGVQQQFGFDLDARFGVRRKAAQLLVEQVRRHAV